MRTTPEILAEKIISHIGREAPWRPIPTNGTQKAAQLLSQLLAGNRGWIDDFSPSRRKASGYQHARTVPEKSSPEHR
jgi:hypothetical protein